LETTWVVDCLMLFTQPSVLLRWFIFSFCLFGQIWIVALSLGLGGAGKMAIAGMLFAAGAVVFFILWGSVASVSGLSIVIDTAAGKRAIENWPSPNFVDWLLDVFYLFFNAALAAVPGVGAVVMMSALRWQLMAQFSGLCGGVIFALAFPVLLLSALDAENPFLPVSTDVIRSFPRHPLAWLMLIVGSVVLMFVLAGMFAVAAWLESSPAIFICCVAAVFCYLLYCRCIGLLALQMGRE
jgi:hypothetical protein